MQGQPPYGNSMSSAVACLCEYLGLISKTLENMQNVEMVM